MARAQCGGQEQGPQPWGECHPRRQRTGCLRTAPAGLPCLLQKPKPAGPFKPHRASPGRLGYCAAPWLRASQPAVPRRVCRTRASTPDPAGLHDSGFANLANQVDLSPEAAPLEPSVDLARNGLKSPSSPWLLGCTEEMLIKVPYGEGNTRTLGAWGRRRMTGNDSRVARLEPLLTLPARRRRRRQPARFTPRSSACRAWGRRRDKGAGGEPGLRAKRPGATD